MFLKNNLLKNLLLHLKTMSFVGAFLLLSPKAQAEIYEVGNAQANTSIGEVPWESLGAGDVVRIHYRPTPYFEKFVIGVSGTEDNPLIIEGVLGPNGELPIISGENATTRSELNYWNEARGVIKIGGANTPSDTLPSHIILRNLHVTSGREPFQFTGRDGQGAYSQNAAAIYVEKAFNLTIEGCEITNSGNGLFIGTNGGQTERIRILNNKIYDNGVEGSIYEHNTYTEATDILYEGNHFRALRAGAGGNNLKDRSAGLIVRYNIIESGNRQLDLVDAEGSQALVNHPLYNETFVYGNLLIEHDGDGNRQILHYGGDSGTIDDYRKGTLYFFFNTVFSTRSNRTTLMRLSTNEEQAEVFGNILYAQELILLDNNGTAFLRNNWLPEAYLNSLESPTDAVSILAGNITGTTPALDSDYRPQSTFMGLNLGGALRAGAEAHEVVKEANAAGGTASRYSDNAPDMGAYEFCSENCNAPFDAGVGESADAGDTGSDAGDTGSDAGDTGSDAGNTGSDAGDTGSDAGNTGSDAGNTDVACGCSQKSKGEIPVESTFALLTISFIFLRRRQQNAFKDAQ